MTRKIKFRGKNKKNGEWFYGNLYDKDIYGRTHICTTTKGCLDIDHDTVGQFTGLKDKNGKEIYEGDIVEYTTCYFGNEKRHRKVVEWESFDSDDFGEPHNLGYFNLSEYMEVIGNIYDNPELLNK